MGDLRFLMRQRQKKGISKLEVFESELHVFCKNFREILIEFNWWGGSVYSLDISKKKPEGQHTIWRIENFGWKEKAGVMRYDLPKIMVYSTRQSNRQKENSYVVRRFAEDFKNFLMAKQILHKQPYLRNPEQGDLYYHPTRFRLFKVVGN